MLNLHQSVVLLVDVQGRLASRVQKSEAMVARLALLLRCAKTLSVPVVWAEQLPEKLGETVESLKRCLPDDAPISKSAFGACGEPRLLAALESHGRRQVLVAGIESHVCVWQTVQQLSGLGYGVYPMVDAISARRRQDHEVALQRMGDLGATVMTVEMAVFEWMGDASHPCFRQVSQMLKQADAATA